MKVKAQTTKPEVESIKVILTTEEATLLVKFLGPTKISTVKDLLPSADDATHQRVNDLLGDLYNLLIDKGGVTYTY